MELEDSVRRGKPDRRGGSCTREKRQDQAVAIERFEWPVQEEIEKIVGGLRGPQQLGVADLILTFYCGAHRLVHDIRGRRLLGRMGKAFATRCRHIEKRSYSFNRRGYLYGVYRPLYHTSIPILSLFIYIQSPLLLNLHLDRSLPNVLSPNPHPRPHHIAHLHTPHPLWRPRQHDIPPLQRHDPTDIT